MLALRLLRWCGIAIGGIILLLVALWGFLQTGPGKHFLAATAGRLASGGGLEVEIAGIEGSVPAAMTIAVVRLRDTRGEFAAVDDLSLVWSPLRLLGGTLAIDRLRARRVAVSRKPELAQNEQSGGGFPVVPLAVDKFSLEEIDLGEAVLGQAMRLSLDASARLVDPAEGLALSFALERHDEPGEIKGDVRYAPERNTLAVDVSATEPPGGFVARAVSIAGHPALSARIVGDGTLDDWNGRLTIAAGEAMNVSGTAAVRRVDRGRRLMFDLGGTISSILPEAWRPIFAGRSEVIGSAVVEADGRIAIEGVNLRGAGVGFALVGDIDVDERTGNLSFDVVAGDAARFAGLVPGLSWRDLRINAQVAGELLRPAVDATLIARDLAGVGYAAGLTTVTATTRPATDGGLSVTVEGAVEALSAADAAVAALLGSKAAFGASGALSPDFDPSIDTASIALAPLDVRFEGRAALDAVSGTLKVERAELAALAPLAGRPLSGSITLDAEVQAARLSAFSAKFRGIGQSITTGVAPLDGFLREDTTVTGTVERRADGSLAVADLELAAYGLDLSVDGRIDQAAADLKARLDISDLARVDSRVAGAVTAEANFTGALDALGVDATISMPSGRAMGRPIDGLELKVSAAHLLDAPEGDLSLKGRIAGKAATGTGRLLSGPNGETRFENVDVAIGTVSAKGAVTLRGGMASGNAAIAAGDLADLSALALTELAGRFDSTLTLDTQAGKQSLSIEATGSGIRAGEQAIASLDAGVTIADLAGAPSLSGKVNVSGLRSGGMVIDTAALVATAVDDDTAFELDAGLNGAKLASSGRLSMRDGYTLRLDTLRIAKADTVASLTAPATITSGPSGWAIDRLALATGNGSAVVGGRVGERLDLDAELKSLPLSLLALASPTLTATGTLSGNLKVAGTPSAPTGSYRLTVARLSAPAIAGAGVGPFDISAEGRLENRRVGLNARLSGPSLKGATINGSVPIGAGEIDLKVRGEASLGLANTFLAASGSRISGTANIDLGVAGTPAAPTVTGRVGVSGGRFDDPVNGVVLTSIEGTLNGSSRSVRVSSLSARTANGGTVSVRGEVGIDSARGFPADLEITLRDAALVSNELARMVASGALSLSGPVATRPRLAGRINVRSLDINIPDRLGGGLPQVDVRHVNVEGGRTQRVGTGSQSAAARAADRKSRGARSAFVADLDLRVSAPNGIFVRGMGVDAELGGDLTIRGTSVAPDALGGFNLRRGRFNVVGRQLNFTRGEITFEGSTDPVLNLVAETRATDVTAQITVTGNASAPRIAFSSVPSLPQDEVLSRILFGRSIGALTPGQALQVAQTIAQFSGGGPGAMDRIRRSLGVDTLDVGANAAGTGAEIGIGKRLNDRIYLGVRQGTTPDSSKVTVDVDITRNIRVQGATGADGANEIGIGAQWDY